MDGEIAVKGIELVATLARQLKKIRAEHHDALAHIGKVFGPPDELAQFYVEPRCQSLNPADLEDEEWSSVPSAPIFEKITGFLKRRDPLRDGSSTMFVLADAGMGKTSLLIMLRLMHLNNFWPSGYDCKLLKLGDSTLHELEDVANPAKTILLLDSLDEDPLAYKRCEERLVELMRATRKFHKTIITCRTQYFPASTPDPIERNGRIQFRSFRCSAYYLSPFSDREVEHYLDKRFRALWFGLKTHPSREHAVKLTQLMKSLRCRPMLLAHIQDFVESDKVFRFEYEMYELLVQRWLVREVEKAHERGKQGMTVNALHSACSVLALAGQQNEQSCFSQEAIERLGREFGDVLQIADLSYEYTGRSLLVRSDEGYRFSHRSFQEFLVVQCLVETPGAIRSFRPRASDLLLDFLAQAEALERPWISQGRSPDQPATLISTFREAGSVERAGEWLIAIRASRGALHRVLGASPHMPTEIRNRLVAEFGADRATSDPPMGELPPHNFSSLADESDLLKALRVQLRRSAPDDDEEDVLEGTTYFVNSPLDLLKSLSSVDLHRLVASNGSPLLIREYVARKANCSDETFELLSADTEPTVRAAVAGNKHCPVAALARLASDPITAVRQAVALHPNVSATIIHALARDADEHVRCMVLANLGMYPRILL